jgi:hypothetical protein
VEVDESLLDEVLAAEAEDDEPEPTSPPAEEQVTETEVTAAHRLPDVPPEDELGEAADEASAAPDAAGGLDLVRITALVGVPLFYQGNMSAPEPHRPFVARAFLPTLEATVRQIQARAPASFGTLLRIQELGMFVGESDLLHTKGRACDWEKLIFEHVTISPGDGDHAAASRSKRRRYWAVAALCRSNSCFVLHGLYNTAHENHIHQDNGISQRFNTMESTVKLCQAILNEIFDQTPKLSTDGDFGEKTRDAMTAAFSKLQIAGTVQDPRAWTRFLRKSARLGFHMSPPA